MSKKAEKKGAVDKLWRELKDLHKYKESIDTMSKAYESLDLKNKQSEKDIDAYKNQIQKLQVRQKFSFFLTTLDKHFSSNCDISSF
jgi:predicted  nucleic acid-binding Zn-ribbon protein